MNPELDDFFYQAGQWSEEMQLLRSLVLECSLEEVKKWRQPCYCLNGKNIAIIGGFKAYCALMFFKGSLLQDDLQMLQSPGENTQAGRQLRFTAVSEIQEYAHVIKQYIYEAIEVEQTGRKVEYKKSGEYEIAEEFKAVLKSNEAVNASFFSLTAGRQKAYNLYFSDAKQAATRISRIEKSLPRILDGYGLTDCTCGLSKKLPGCDGSHRSLGTK